MNNTKKLILVTTSIIILIEGLLMLLPFAYGMLIGEIRPAKGFLIVAISCIAFGFVMRKNIKFFNINIKAREGIFSTLISWFVVALLGSLPYFFSGSGYSLIDSIFESFAGWTTTGAFVIDYASMPKSLLLWKAISNWFGGMGLIMLTISIFPAMGIGGQKMVVVEVPSPSLEKVYSHASQTAKISYLIYMFLTLSEIILLIIGGMNPFDATINGLSTISTSGILNSRGSVGLAYTPFIKGVFTLFALIGSTTFILYALIFTGQIKRAFKNFEFRSYLLILGASGITVAVILLLTGNYNNPLKAFASSLSQCISFGSTSGFVVDNLNNWPAAAQMILLALLFVGACSFSSGGSIKVIRVVIFFKVMMRGIYKRIHPMAIKPIIINKQPISAKGASAVSMFIMIYFALFICASIVVSLDGEDLLTTLSATLAALSNNGTGFGSVYHGDFSYFSGPIKLFLSLIMLMGRLEIYPVILLLSRSYWNQERASE